MLGKELVESVFEDPDTADIDLKLRAMLIFLEKMTLDPSGLKREDGAALFDAGLTRDEIDDALKVGFAFNLIVRLADSFDFHVPTEEEFSKGAEMLAKHGYKM